MCVFEFEICMNLCIKMLLVFVLSVDREKQILFFLEEKEIRHFKLIIYVYMRTYTYEHNSHYLITLTSTHVKEQEAFKYAISHKFHTQRYTYATHFTLHTHDV